MKYEIFDEFVSEKIFNHVIKIELNEIALETENKILKEALGFYADKGNWSGYGDSPNTSDHHLIDFCDVDTPRGISICPVEVFYAGKKAREALKQIEQLNKEASDEN